MARPAATDSPQPIAVFVSFSGAGGVERMVANLVRAFVDMGQPVDLLLVRADSPHLARLPPEVNLVHLGTNHTFWALPALARYLRTNRPACLLAAKDRAGRTAVLARRLAGADVRIVMRLGTNLSTSMAGKWGVERWLRYLPIRRLYPLVDQIVAVSAGVARDIANIARIPAERIRVIRNPVITPELTALAAQPLTHAWFRPGQAPIIVGAGRLQRQKDFATLIRAFALARQERPCRLLILGEGGERSRLQALIGELGLSGEVDLPGFQVNPYPFLARADLFVLSSLWEGSPNVLTEAMALGTAVVSTDCPSGPGELLDGGRYGTLVPVADVEAMAGAILQTLVQPPQPEMLKAAVAEYDQAWSARQYLEALGVRQL